MWVGYVGEEGGGNKFPLQPAERRPLLGAITAAGGYYLPQVSDGCGGMKDGQHGPAVVQEPDVVLLVEDLWWWKIVR